MGSFREAECGGLALGPQQGQVLVQVARQEVLVGVLSAVGQGRAVGSPYRGPDDSSRASQQVRGRAGRDRAELVGDRK